MNKLNISKLKKNKFPNASLFIIHLKDILSTTGDEILEFRFVALSNRVSILSVGYERKIHCK